MVLAKSVKKLFSITTMGFVLSLFFSLLLGGAAIAGKEYAMVVCTASGGANKGFNTLVEGHVGKTELLSSQTCIEALDRLGKDGFELKGSPTSVNDQVLYMMEK